MRQYICFCCGVPFDNFSEFAKHIIDNHEESRDYVRCPLIRCGACVRDLRLHFTARHPGDKCPKIGQMRALVWTDHKPPSKKKKVKFHEGYINSQKNGGQKMHYRSSWERDVYICLENWSEVVGYKVESFPVEYYWKGRKKRYFPDLFVTFKDNHHEVWEIKPENQKQLEINKAKWVACEGYCETRGWKFDVVSEQKIKDLKAKVRLEIGLLVDNALPLDFFTDGKIE